MNEVGKDIVMCPPLPFGILRFKRQNTKKGVNFGRERLDLPKKEELPNKVGY